MSDMSKTIVARADQMNAEDFRGGPQTFTVERVTVKPSSEDQPVSIYMVGHDATKPFKPCKTFRRVLVQIWGDNSRDYVGKSMTLFRNPDVMFGGEKVGGIEISHMSGLAEPRTLKLTATRGKKRTITIQPLKVTAKEPTKPTKPKHPLADNLNAIVKKWKHQAEDHESDATPDAFREWIERTTSGEVLANDAMQPDKYTQELIDHLNEVLG